MKTIHEKKGVIEDVFFQTILSFVLSRKIINIYCCFQLFGDGKYVFFSQKSDEKMVFTWYFLAFHDVPEREKYRFSCSGAYDHLVWAVWLNG